MGRESFRQQPVQDHIRRWRLAVNDRAVYGQDDRLLAGASWQSARRAWTDTGTRILHPMPTPAPVASSVTAIVLPRISRSPVKRKRSPSLWWAPSTRVLRNVILGLLSTSKKSADRRCTSRSATPVSMLAASHVLHYPAPEQGRDAEQERDPEPIPEHRHVVPLVAIVRAGRALNGVSDRPMWPRAFAGHVDRGR